DIIVKAARRDAFLKDSPHMLAEMEAVVHDIGEADSRFIAECVLLASAHQAAGKKNGIQKNDVHALAAAWSAIIGACRKLESAFHAAKILSDDFPALSKHFIHRAEQLRDSEGLSGRLSGEAQLLVTRLVVRAFAGMLQAEVGGREDFEEVLRVIELIAD